jgi:hypothetical protein
MKSWRFTAREVVCKGAPTVCLSVAMAIPLACGNTKKDETKAASAITWKVKISDVYSTDQIESGGTIEPDGTKNLLGPKKETDRFILLTIELENLLGKANRYKVEDVYLADQEGRKYATLGLVLDHRKPSVAFGFVFKDPITVSPRKVFTDTPTTSFIFLAPKATANFTLRFPGALPVDIYLPAIRAEAVSHWPQ